MDLESPPVKSCKSGDAPNGGTAKTFSGFERREIVDEVKSHFSNLDKFHGALTERILIYGHSGVGKRCVANQAAKEIAAADGRTILTVEAGTFEIFIRDYYNVYTILTGEKLPAGLGVPLSLSKIKHTLEKRRQEWLLVLLDVAAFIDDSNNNTRQKMNIYVPDRGQIIMTSSEVVPNPRKGKDSKEPEHVCTLELNAGPNAMWLPSTTTSKTFSSYAHQCCPALLDISRKTMWKIYGESGPTLLFLTVTAANLQLLNISLEDYVSICRKRLGKRPPADKPLARGTAAFNVAMRVLWNALEDHDRWSLKVLAAVAIAEPLGTPLDLARRLFRV